MASANATAGGADASVEGASMLPATEAGAATLSTCPSGALANAATFIPLSETVLSTTEAVVCGVSGQAKELLKENATASMARPKALASLVFMAVTPLLHGRVLRQSKEGLEFHRGNYGPEAG